MQTAQKTPCSDCELWHAYAHHLDRHPELRAETDSSGERNRDRALLRPKSQLMTGKGGRTLDTNRESPGPKTGWLVRDSVILAVGS